METENTSLCRLVVNWPKLPPHSCVYISTIFLIQRYLLSWRFILRVAHSSKWTEKWTVKCINVATEALSLSLVGMWYWTKFSSLIEEFQCKSNIEARGLQWLPEQFVVIVLRKCIKINLKKRRVYIPQVPVILEQIMLLTDTLPQQKKKKLNKIF